MATLKFSFLVAVALIAVPAVSVARADHLIFSEILVNPSGTETDDISSEYVEIFNPTTGPIPLDDYYLSNYNNYFMLPAGSFDYGDRSHFMLKFPAGATIAPSSTVIVCQGASTFFSALGFSGSLVNFQNQQGTPTLYEVKDTDSEVPNMVNLKSGLPRQDNLALDNTGQLLALFHWDGESDLVKDVDLVRWGTPLAENSLMLKTGIAIDGPDADTDASTYADDAGPSSPTYTGTVVVLKREVSDESGEVSTGGNGITGHDETTEQLHTSYASVPQAALSPGLPDVELYQTNVEDWQAY